MALAEWCERYTPLLSLDRTKHPCGLMLDITGCAHLIGGEEEIRSDIMHRLAMQGFDASTAIAATPGAAWAVARFGHILKSRIIAPGDEKQQLSRLPLHALRIDKGQIDSLKRMGLLSIGCIADLPRAPLAARYGPMLLRRLDQAFGYEDEAISPRMPVAELVAERQFAEPIALEEDISRTVLSLAKNLKPGLEARGLGARMLELKLFRVDGERNSLNVITANPERDPVHIERLFRERLAGLHNPLEAGFGFDLIRLEISATDPMQQRQSDLISQTHCEDGLIALIDRLGARLGTDRVQRFVMSETHIPERSFGLLPAIHTPHRKVNSSPRSHGSLALAEPEELQTHDEQLTRPIMLLNRPEVVDVMAEIPEGPPLRFRWRKVTYEIMASEGPERISCEWWRDGRNAMSRDYYKVEDSTGRRFWIYRLGLYERETNHPRWYMHGMFP